MKFIYSLLILCSVLSSKTFAGESGAVAQTRECSSYTSFPSEVGFSCRTSKGIEFKRISVNGQLSWRDMGEGGLIWHGYGYANVDNSVVRARLFCEQEQGTQRLPTGYPPRLNGRYGFANQNSEFVVAESHGIREVLRDMNNRNLFSSSVTPRWGDPFVFNGYSGEIMSESNPGRDYAFWCVSNP